MTWLWYSIKMDRNVVCAAMLGHFRSSELRMSDKLICIIFNFSKQNIYGNISFIPCLLSLWWITHSKKIKIKFQTLNGYKTIHWAFHSQQDSFHGNNPYSFNVLFSRVYNFCIVLRGMTLNWNMHERCIDTMTLPVNVIIKVIQNWCLTKVGRW